MAIDVFSSGEEIIWQGKTLEVSSLSVSHGYNPVPKAVSPRLADVLQCGR